MLRDRVNAVPQHKGSFARVRLRLAALQNNLIAGLAKVANDILKSVRVHLPRQGQTIINSNLQTDHAADAGLLP